jgi:perosamine synthetase
VRNHFLPLARPSLGDEEIAAVVETLRSGWLTTGPRVREFQEKFRLLVGAAHAVAINSGTAALHLALDAVGIRRGDEVIVPTMTFAATAEVVRYFDAVPVLVDVERASLNIDPERIARAISPRTRAIVPVHYAGQVCAMDAILDLARRHDLRVIEDAAHALPASYRGVPVGKIGDLTCFSFYPTKSITTGEGGMVTTENAEWAERMRMKSLHGLSRDAWTRYSREGSWYYEIHEVGYKYNMTDIAAAIGVAQLDKCAAMHKTRLRIAARYSEALSKLEEVEVPSWPPDEAHAWHLYVLRLRLERLALSRGQFIEELRTRNVGASVHFIPLHLHPYYRQTYGYRERDFAVAFDEYQRLVSLPMFAGMDDADADDVIEAVHDIVARFRR